MKVLSARRQSPRKFKVELTEGEMDFILGVCGHVAGHETKSPRKYAERLIPKLEKALGYSLFETDFTSLARGLVVACAYGSAPVTQAERLVDATNFVFWELIDTDRVPLPDD
jgi:hypothetical protein